MQSDHLEGCPCRTAVIPTSGGCIKKPHEHACYFCICHRIPTPVQPSAADLDAVAEEQRVKEVTASPRSAPYPLAYRASALNMWEVVCIASEVDAFIARMDAAQTTREHAHNEEIQKLRREAEFYAKEIEHLRLAVAYAVHGCVDVGIFSEQLKVLKLAGMNYQDVAALKGNF